MRALLGACALCLACGHAAGPCVPGGTPSQPYPTLAEWCLDSATPYDLNTPLFSDGAVKQRSMLLPAGKPAAYQATSALDFPQGTILIKRFGFRDDLRKPQPLVRWIETRLLVRQDDGLWHGYAYVWDAAQKGAALSQGGEVQSISWLDETGATVTANYLVPSATQCRECHDASGVTLPLGPKARNLNKGDQLARLSSAGLLSGLPSSGVPRMPVWNDPATGSLDERARAYLEVNCAHCHSTEGAARTTGLLLPASETIPAHYGVCKSPVAAGEATGGFSWDVVPGDPDHSILSYRLAATKSSIAMPLIGRSVVDKEGLALVRQWIAGLPGSCP